MKESIYLNDANFDLEEFTELWMLFILTEYEIGQHLALHEQFTKPVKSGLICMNEH